MAEVQHYFDENRESWNKRVAVHMQSDFYDLDGFKAGNCSLREIEREELGDVRGKTLLHLQCHFGQDTLSWERRGATCTGLDFSESAIQAARDLATELGLKSRFVCSNVYDTAKNIASQFDIVFTSYGTVGWLPDLKPWAAVVSSMLKPGGTFYMADFHPLIWIFDDSLQRVAYPYQRSDVITEEYHGSYADADAPIHGQDHSWSHGLGDIITSLIDAGLNIDFLHEFNYSPYNIFQGSYDTGGGRFMVRGLENKVPFVFSIRAMRK